MENDGHTNGNQKKAEMAIFVMDKIDFKSKTKIRDKEEHYILTKGPVCQGDITIINIYISNSRAPKYLKQVLTE